MLEKLGLNRPELSSWAMYDWAISGLQTVIMTAVFPVFFVRVAGANLEGSSAVQQLARANTIAYVVVALLAPILGAVADYSASKKRFLALFTGIGVMATASMFSIGHGDLRLAQTLFIFALIGAAGSMVFYEGLLPHLASRDEVDRVSTAGYALGYFGGGVLVALNLAWIQKPAMFGIPAGTLPARLAFVSVAVWWVIFALPLFLKVREPARQLEKDEQAGENPIVVGFRRLGETLKELRGYKQAFLMLLAFLIYNDGIQTIIKMATAYGTEIGLSDKVLIGAVVLVQFVGVPFAILFGRLAGRIGAKNAILLGLATYAAISILGYFMRTATHFFILAGLVGMVQGGCQALSRSLFASMTPPHKSGEFFGFYGVFEKFAGVFGPLLFDVAITMTGSSRSAILTIIIFFIVGAILLMRVDVAAGRAAAEERELALLKH